MTARHVRTHDRPMPGVIALHDGTAVYVRSQPNGGRHRFKVSRDGHECERWQFSEVDRGGMRYCRACGQMRVIV